jgi:hypothetical protein
MSLMSLMFKNDARSLASLVTMWLSVKKIKYARNGRPSLFGGVHQIETSLFHALLVY